MKKGNTAVEKTCQLIRKAVQYRATTAVAERPQTQVQQIKVVIKKGNTAVKKTCQLIMRAVQYRAITTK